MGGKCRPGAWLVQGSPRPCAPFNVQCPSSPATSTPHPSCIAVCDGSVIDPRQTINCNANAINDEVSVASGRKGGRALGGVAEPPYTLGPFHQPGHVPRPCRPV